MKRRRAAARPLASVLAEVPGYWVAIDRRANEPRAVAANLYELGTKIRDLKLHSVAVVRAPNPTDPELVGLASKLLPPFPVGLPI